jgi:DNA-binding XRE family transcriptional regulator
MCSEQLHICLRVCIVAFMPTRKRSSRNALNRRLALRTEVLAALRHQKCLHTNAALAEAAGMDRGTLWRVLNGRVQPGPNVQLRLCAALDAQIGDLFYAAPIEEEAA